MTSRIINFNGVWIDLAHVLTARVDDDWQGDVRVVMAFRDKPLCLPVATDAQGLPVHANAFNDPLHDRAPQWKGDTFRAAHERHERAKQVLDRFVTLWKGEK